MAIKTGPSQVEPSWLSVPLRPTPAPTMSTTVNRALELARNGPCRNTKELRAALTAERGVLSGQRDEEGIKTDFRMAVARSISDSEAKNDGTV